MYKTSKFFPGFENYAITPSLSHPELMSKSINALTPEQKTKNR